MSRHPAVVATRLAARVLRSYERRGYITNEWWLGAGPDGEVEAHVKIPAHVTHLTLDVAI